MKYSGHRKLLCELSKLNALILLGYQRNTGFNMYAKNTQQQLTFLTLLPWFYLYSSISSGGRLKCFFTDSSDPNILEFSLNINGDRISLNCTVLLFICSTLYYIVQFLYHVLSNIVRLLYILYFTYNQIAILCPALYYYCTVLHLTVLSVYCTSTTLMLCILLSFTSFAVLCCICFFQIVTYFITLHCVYFLLCCGVLDTTLFIMYH